MKKWRRESKIRLINFGRSPNRLWTRLSVPSMKFREFINYFKFFSCLKSFWCFIFCFTCFPLDSFVPVYPHLSLFSIFVPVYLYLSLFWLFIPVYPYLSLFVGLELGFFASVLKKSLSVLITHKKNSCNYLIRFISDTVFVTLQSVFRTYLEANFLKPTKMKF